MSAHYIHYLPTSPFTPTLPTSPSLAMAFNNSSQRLFRLAVPLAIGASLAGQAIYDVRGGTRAVIFDRFVGVKEGVINEGTHFLVPWLQKSIIFDVRTKPRNIATTTGSKDLQMVSLTLRVLHRPEVQALPKIYQVCRPPHLAVCTRIPSLTTVTEPRPRLRRACPPLHRQ